MSIEHNPLVSIVTPAYNEERYLADCIESVLAQTYHNWDYTIVDNCSTDRTAEIACRYAAKDQRIRVCRNQKLLSVIPNHNVALRQISPASKYCKMVLGDDWMFPDCLEQMVALAESHPSVGIVGAYALEGERVAWTGLPYPSSLVSGREICRRHLLEGLYVFGSANAVLYRADLVRSRDPFYSEDNIHADTDICFALLRSSDFGFVHQVLTFTRLRPSSLATVSNDLQTGLGSMLELLLTYGPEYLTRAEYDCAVKRHVANYYRSLGKSLMLGRTHLWNYHKEKLRRSPVGYSLARLARGILETVSIAALNPKDSIERLIRGQYRARVQASSNSIKPNAESELTTQPRQEARQSTSAFHIE